VCNIILFEFNKNLISFKMSLTENFITFYDFIQNIIITIFNGSNSKLPDYKSRIYGCNTYGGKLCPAGVGVTQLWQEPGLEYLEPFYTQFEKDYDADWLIPTMHKYSYLVYSIVVAYVMFVKLVPHEMKKKYFSITIGEEEREDKHNPGKKIMIPIRPKWLTTVAAYWNAFLSIFSAWGAIRTVPHLMYYILVKHKDNFRNTICIAPTLSYGHGGTGLASQMFIISKLPELFDTVLLLLKGKKLIFLHWYHHATVLAFCWNSYVTEGGNGLYFIAMNYTVHSIMYAYYCAMELKSVPEWFPTPLITLMQTSQMVIGTYIVGMSIYYKFDDEGDCKNDDYNLIFGVIIYSSYLYLFVAFAIERYNLFGKKKDEDNVEKKKKEKKEL
jgi:elongation of very long chain fatty acids protein 6